MTVEITLTKGYTAIVDDEDADLAELKWYALFAPDYANGGAYIAVRGVSGSANIRMHREIMARVLGRLFLLPREQVDHIDRNTLNNKRSNLRLATPAQNTVNRSKHKNNKSGFKGVYLDKRTGRYRAQIALQHNIQRLGYFDTPEEAYEAYCEAGRELHGEFFNPGGNHDQS